MAFLALRCKLSHQLLRGAIYATEYTRNEFASALSEIKCLADFRSARDRDRFPIPQNADSPGKLAPDSQVSRQPFACTPILDGQTQTITQVILGVAGHE